MTLFSKCAFVAVGLCASVATLHAAPVNGTGNVTPDVIFGSGNANGSFTGQTANNIEVGLRGKQRYPAANTFNYDGDHTYTFDSTVLTTNPLNRSVFNFEWSVNVDQNGLSGDKLSAYDYSFGFDTDPTSGVSYTFIDPFTTLGYFDHALGTNATANGGGIESSSNAELVTNMGVFNVAQQSSNLGFGFSSDPDLAGLYSFSFSVFEKGTQTLLSSSTINVAVAPLPVPEPATLSLVLGALGLLGYASRRRAKRQG